MKVYQLAKVFALCLLVVGAFACRKVKVGYLDATFASFEPDYAEAYKEVPEGSNWAKYGSPYTSLRIQGVAGTMPINYDFLDVKASEGGDAELFKQCVREKTISVAGGIIQMFPAAAKKLPNGKYLISLRVYNDDHEATLKDIFTFVVKDRQEEI